MKDQLSVDMDDEFATVPRIVMRDDLPRWVDGVTAGRLDELSLSEARGALNTLLKACEDDDLRSSTTLTLHAIKLFLEVWILRGVSPELQPLSNLINALNDLDLGITQPLLKPRRSQSGHLASHPIRDLKMRSIAATNVLVHRGGLKRKVADARVSERIEVTARTIGLTMTAASIESWRRELRKERQSRGREAFWRTRYGSILRELELGIRAKSRTLSIDEILDWLLNPLKGGGNSPLKPRPQITDRSVSSRLRRPHRDGGHVDATDERAGNEWSEQF